MLLPKVVRDQNGPISKLHKSLLPQFYCNLLILFQRAVLEEAPLCNDQQIHLIQWSNLTVRYILSTAVTICCSLQGDFFQNTVNLCICLKPTFWSMHRGGIYQFFVHFFV